jgi:glutamine synthetase
MVFSMMPKPFADQPGSGLHFHVSLWQGQGENARCVFTPHHADGSLDPAGTLSPLGRHFMAGVLAHAAACDRAGGADCQLVQATDGGRIAVGHHLGPGLRGPWPQQPQRAGAHAARPLRVAAARCQLQPLPGHRGVDRCRAGRHRPPAGPRPGLHRRPVRPAAGQDPRPWHRPPAPESGRGLRRAGGRQRAGHRAGLHAAAQFLALKRDEALAYARHVSTWELERYAALF